MWPSGLKPNTVSVRIWVQSLASLSGLGIWHCLKLQHRLQIWLGSIISVAVMQACSCSFNSTPCPETSICCRCHLKKGKQTKNSEQIILRKEKKFTPGRMTNISNKPRKCVRENEEKTVILAHNRSVRWLSYCGKQ